MRNHCNRNILLYDDDSRPLFCGPGPMVFGSLRPPRVRRVRNRRKLLHESLEINTEAGNEREVIFLQVCSGGTVVVEIQYDA